MKSGNLVLNRGILVYPLLEPRDVVSSETFHEVKIKLIRGTDLSSSRVESSPPPGTPALLGPAPGCCDPQPPGGFPTCVSHWEGKRD